MNGALVDALHDAGGIDAIPEDLCTEQRIGPWKVWAVYVLLAQYADVHGNAWLSQRTVVGLLRMARRDVQIALDVLENGKLLSRNGKRERVVIWHFALADSPGDGTGTPVQIVPGDRTGDRTGDWTGDWTGTPGTTQLDLTTSNTREQRSDPPQPPQPPDVACLKDLFDTLRREYGHKVTANGRTRGIARDFDRAGWPVAKIVRVLGERLSLRTVGTGLVIETLGELAAEAITEHERDAWAAPAQPAYDECSGCGRPCRRGAVLCAACSGADRNGSAGLQPARLRAVP